MKRALIAFALVASCGNTSSRSQSGPATEDQFPPLVPPGLPALSVAAYGAIGDGVTDNRVALANALAAVAGTGKVLAFPPGTYVVSSGCTGNGVAVQVPAVANIRLYGPGATLKWNSDNCGLFELQNGTSQVTVDGLFFQGAIDDNIATNINPAFVALDGATDVIVENSTFDHVQPMSWYDSGVSARLHFVHNYVHNSPLGLSPPSHSVIEGNSFVCDSVVSTRGQAIYVYGREEDVRISHNEFKNIANEDIQIHGDTTRFYEKNNFVIDGNYFENSASYSVWIGSLAHAQTGSFVVSNNTFKNVAVAINGEGVETATVTGNHIEYDFEMPYTSAAGPAIQFTGAPGGTGTWANSSGIVISGNKLIHRHPYFGKVTFASQPSDGDTLTVGDIVYTFRNSPSVAYDVKIGTSTTATAQNLHSTLQADDGLATGMNNAMRKRTDALWNPVATSGVAPENNGNQVIVVSSYSFTFSTSDSTAMTLSGVQAGLSMIPTGISVNETIAPVIDGNEIDDFPIGIVVSQNYAPVVKDNVLTTDGASQAWLIEGLGNGLSTYSGNRIVSKNLLNAPRQNTIMQCSDAFPVIEDDAFPYHQQLTNSAYLGRSGVVPIGNGKAYTLLYYGPETTQGGSPDASTLLWRWNDGDEVKIYDQFTTYILTFKRSSPGSNQFNSAASLITAINALNSGEFTAGFISINNDQGAPNPDLMIKISASAAGTLANGDRVYVERYKDSATSTGTSYQRTAQPLLNGLTLQSKVNPDQFTPLGGGCTAYTCTFVETPLANPEKPVFVQGVDSTSQALAPIVYQANIISGVGFTITHSAGSGTENFYYRVGG